MLDSTGGEVGTLAIDQPVIVIHCHADGPTSHRFVYLQLDLMFNMFEYLVKN